MKYAEAVYDIRGSKGIELIKDKKKIKPPKILNFHFTSDLKVVFSFIFLT
jgi:hypothetical protein